MPKKRPDRPGPFYDCSCEWTVWFEREFVVTTPRGKRGTFKVKCPPGPPPPYKILPIVDFHDYQVKFVKTTSLLRGK